MANIIYKEQLEKAVSGTRISGLILCGSYNIQLTKTNKEYVAGTMRSGCDIQFKAWGTSSAFTKLKSEEHQNCVCNISGTFDNYGGNLSIILDDIVAVEYDDISVFLPTKYDTDAYWNALVATVKQTVSEKAFNIANKVLFENEEVAKAFKIEFAASGHHDNCKGGLLAHTYKVVRNMIYLAQSYPVYNKEWGLDLLVLGALFHDIGKTREMKLGVYQKESMVTHRYLGIEMLDRDLIIQSYNEEFYMFMVSIILQHHDTFDDKARTLYAQMVFFADIADAWMTDIQQAMETPISGSVPKIKFDGKYLIY